MSSRPTGTVAGPLRIQMRDVVLAGDVVGPWEPWRARFELVRPLGHSGSEGEVWEAIERGPTERLVALKMHPGDPQTPPFDRPLLERLDGLEAIAALMGDIPGLVRCRSPFTGPRPFRPHLQQEGPDGRLQIPDGLAGWTYLPMERVEGSTFHEVLHEHRHVRDLAERLRLLEFLRPVVATLGAMRAAGLVHGDVKPANIMCQADDWGEYDAVLIDPGLLTVSGPAGAEAGTAASSTGMELLSQPELGLAADADAVHDLVLVALRPDLSWPLTRAQQSAADGWLEDRICDGEIWARPGRAEPWNGAVPLTATRRGVLPVEQLSLIVGSLALDAHARRLNAETERAISDGLVTAVQIGDQLAERSAAVNRSVLGLTGPAPPFEDVDVWSSCPLPPAMTADQEAAQDLLKACLEQWQSGTTARFPVPPPTPTATQSVQARTQWTRYVEVPFQPRNSEHIRQAAVHVVRMYACAIRLLLEQNASTAQIHSWIGEVETVAVTALEQDRGSQTFDLPAERAADQPRLAYLQSELARAVWVLGGHRIEQRQECYLRWRSTAKFALLDEIERRFGQAAARAAHPCFTRDEDPFVAVDRHDQLAADARQFLMAVAPTLNDAAFYPKPASEEWMHQDARNAVARAVVVAEGQ